MQVKTQLFLFFYLLYFVGECAILRPAAVRYSLARPLTLVALSCPSRAEKRRCPSHEKFFARLSRALSVSRAHQTSKRRQVMSKSCLRSVFRVSHTKCNPLLRRSRHNPRTSSESVRSPLGRRGSPKRHTIRKAQYCESCNGNRLLSHTHSRG